MTAPRCEGCGRGLAADVAFCPYCGADRRPPPPAAAVEPAPAPAQAPVSDAAAPVSSPAAEPVAVPVPATAAAPSPPASTASGSPAPAKTRTKPAARKRGGCGLRLLLALMLAAAVLAWCAVRVGRGDVPAPVPDAVAVRPLRVSLRWRTTPLPGEAAADARFAVSSTVALRVRANDRVYTVRPGHPLRLPDGLGEGIEVRAADWVTPQQAAHAHATLSTLRGG